MESSRTPSPERHSSAHGSPTARKRSYNDMTTHVAYDNDENERPSSTTDNATPKSKSKSKPKSSDVSSRPDPTSGPSHEASDLDSETDTPKDPATGDESVGSEELSEDIATEPHDPLQEFDWYTFESGYHDMIRSRQKHEEQLLNEFRALCEARSSTALTRTECKG